MMFKIVLQCFIHDLVVAMILAPILKHPFPRLAIFEFSACKDSHHALGRPDCVAVLHGKSNQYGFDGELPRSLIRWSLRCLTLCHVFDFEHTAFDVEVTLRIWYLNTGRREVFVYQVIQVASESARLV